MSKVAFYPGTFDPITNGHLDLIKRAADLFDQVIIGIAENSKKKTLFNASERHKMAESVLSRFDNVVVKSFSGLTVDFARQENAQVILRGLRAVSDFDFEFQLSAMNKKIASDIETIFLPASASDSYISSTLVREIAGLGGDVSPFVDALVSTELARVFAR
jgi:pantetheine-phosphate adenylyltransferase